ncbi:response regulator [Paenibacillus mendelii]|uniref:Response regulator n=1 Tax=Paenibacillus mendelii TaxID=206163 RepID=A0ABV6J7J1_9BACL|nr:response regulator [Paenibacillus mendelii]MCQ6562155.1 response regulator [Paenibacillus mendelii]
MKVMIVEDEPLLRQGLISKIKWQSLNLQLEGEAGDGIEALHKLEECKPDIVLTDVRMPGIDGLQFIQRARQDYPRIKFVIISGYGEFDYVREAMKHSVKDYLLKPVDGEMLNHLLFELREELHREQIEDHNRIHLEELGQLYLRGNLQSTDHILTRFLTDPDLEHSLEGLPPSLTKRRYFTAATAKIAYRRDEQDQWEQDCSLARFSVHNVMQNGLSAASPEEASLTVFKHAHKLDEVILFFGYEEEVTMYKVKKNLHLLLEWIQENLGIHLSIGIGAAKESYQLLPLAYMESQKMLKNRLLDGDGKLYCADDARPAPITASPLLNEHTGRMLLGLLEAGKHITFMNAVEELMRGSLDSDNRYEHFEYLYTEVIHIIRKHAYKSGVQLPITALSAPLADLEFASDWLDVKALLEDQLNGLAELTTDRFGDRSSDAIIDSVRQYVSQHYAEELTLQWVSDTYFIHPNYFSRRFKQITGSCFNDYLTRIRVERSKDLLATTTLRINLISQMVGYEDQNYFCNVFRKVTGSSPTCYRKENS